MNIARVALIVLSGAITASCSKKSAPERDGPSSSEHLTSHQEIAGGDAESTSVAKDQGSSKETTEATAAADEDELRPHDDEIAEDCVAFLRATKTVPAQGANSDCPQCTSNAEAKEVLKFDGIEVGRLERTEFTCEVNVTIRATFNPSTRESIAGGLTAWISPEQKAQYLQGVTPPGQQVYKVKVSYRRDSRGWRAVEFDHP